MKWYDSNSWCDYINLVTFFIPFYISQCLTLWYFVFLYLIFLSQQVLYFLLSTLVLTLYIDVVLSLSIANFFLNSKETSVMNLLLCLNLHFSCLGKYRDYSCIVSVWNAYTVQYIGEETFIEMQTLLASCQIRLHIDYIDKKTDMSVCTVLGVLLSNMMS